jgi:phytoene dehydrogenase-like protein
VVFEEPVAETIDRYVSDQRLKDALFGQGVIGAFAGPRDPGTASVKLMHFQGDLEGQGPEWGYVVGGMGRVSFAIAQAALEAGATIAAGVAVARIAPGGDVEADRAMISIQHGLDAAQEGFEACRRGEPAIGFCELYFQTAYDPSVAPRGHHTMSAFCQYAPYELAEGDWEGRRDEIGNLILDAIAAYAPDVHECVEHAEVLGPPDIESRIGLTGGSIFQGETMPDQMWDRRLEWRTPIEGFYLCGAATHPAGSVIALNGRNAAMAVLEDLEGAVVTTRSEEA